MAETPLSPMPNDSPYVGPRPFEREDSGRFFGRERETAELLSLVVAHRVTVFYAPSGAGKTSLLKAGLIPHLEAKGFEVLPPTRVLGPAESSDLDVANIYAFQALAGLEGDDADPAYLAQLTIADYLNEQGAFLDKYGLPAPRVLIFDQFEELFTAYPARWEEREGFFVQLQEALEAVPLLRIIFSLREDYLAQLEPYAAMMPDNLRHRLRLERMRPEAALSAVRGPLQQTNRTFTDGAAEKLVEELQKIRVEQQNRTITAVGRFIEPVQLQVVCQNLWESLPPAVTTITERELAAYGDVTKALSQFYVSAVRRTIRQPDVQVKEGELRDWFEKQLITPAETRSIVFQDKETGLTGGIPNEAIRHLDRQHIIRGEVRSGSRWFELTHDRFIDPILKANQDWRQELFNRRVRLGLTGLGILFVIGLCALLVAALIVPPAIAEGERAEDATATVAAQQTAVAAQLQQAVAEQTRAAIQAATATFQAQVAAEATAVAIDNSVYATALSQAPTERNPDVYLATSNTSFETWTAEERLESLTQLVLFEGETYSEGALNLFYSLSEAEQQAMLTSGGATSGEGAVRLVELILQSWTALSTTSSNSSLEALEATLKPYPDTAGAGVLLNEISIYKRARIRGDSDTGDDALSLYTALIEADMDNPLLYLERGQAYARYGNGFEAIADYETVISLLSVHDSRQTLLSWDTEMREVLATAVCSDPVFGLLLTNPEAYADSLLSQIPQDCVFWMSAWPTDYFQINQTFGENPSSYEPFGLPGHEGIDIEAPEGTNIYAVADGVVERVDDAASGRSYGNAVYIRHLTSYRTVYAQLFSVNVEVGDVVKAGQLIGLAGNTGNSFGAHLHFGLYMDGATEAGLTDYPFDIIDPTPYLMPLFSEAEAAS